MGYFLSPGAKLILAGLTAAGYEAYVVGGAVRSMALGLPVEDWDITTTAPPDEILRLFPAARLTGKAYGTVTVQMGAQKYEVTPCRREEGYADGRHPDKVTFGAPLQEDLARRDFTMNAVAYNGRALVDPYGGLQDIQNKKIRCVGEAAQRFEEDALRILRAYRFAAALGFTLEAETERAALEKSAALAKIPSARVRAEVQKALLSPAPSALSPLVSAGALLPFGIPASAGLPLLDKVPAAMLLRWWALLCMTGASARFVCSSLQFSADFEKDLEALFTLYGAGPSQNIKQLKQKLRHGAPLPYGEIAAAFFALDSAFLREGALFEELAESGEAYNVKMLALGGGDLACRGFRGKEISQTLELLLDAVIEAPSLNRHGALLGLAQNLRALF